MSALGARRGPWWVVLLTAGTVLCSCAQAVPLRHDAALQSRITAAIRDDRSVRFREITEGDWDRVHLFPVPVTRAFVEDSVGGQVEMPDVYDAAGGGIVVFTRGGTVQRASVLQPFPLEGWYCSYDYLVVARPTANGLSLGPS